jgi:hypothetical protein
MRKRKPVSNLKVETGFRNTNFNLLEYVGETA